MRTAVTLPACLISALVLLSASSHLVAADGPAAPVKFKVEEIDKTLGVGYGLVIADMNGDKKPDIVVADSARVIWFENPSWKMHTVITNKAAGVVADNVCLDVYDIDGDGKLDIVLGADWQPNETGAHGSLQWLKHPADESGMWEVFKIADSIPTLHRVHFGDVDPDRGAELYVGPLKGKGSTAANNWSDAGAPLLMFKIPNMPASKDAEWKPVVLTDALHVMHNFLPISGGQWNGVLTASYEGVNLVAKEKDGSYSVTKIGAGDQRKPAESHGSSEIKLGKLNKGATPMLATIEPFHGNRVVAYTPPDEETKPGLWRMHVIDETLQGGHAIGCADFDGDGNDEIVAGWREGPKTGINLYKLMPPAKGSDEEFPWMKFPVDEGGIACEDLACFDLNGDGRPDIIACGRATHNVRIYWNEGAPK